MPQIIFIRHAEKPHDHSDSHLSDKGLRRAQLLADYILHPWAGEVRVPRHAYIMVMGDSKKSRRCVETMKPTLEQAGNRLSCTHVHRSRGTELARRLISSPREDAIVCWEHSRIVDILNLMGVGVRSWGLDPESDTIDGTSKHCFDATWVADVSMTHIRLRVYRQFDVVNGVALWRHNRNHVWFERTYKNGGLSEFQAKGQLPSLCRLM